MQITNITFLLFSLFALQAFAFPAFLTRKEHDGQDKAAGQMMNGTRMGMGMGMGKMDHGGKDKNSTMGMCKDIKMLMHLSMVASNQTAMAAFTAKAKNVTEATDKLMGAAAKLATMTKNATMVAECVKVDATMKMNMTCHMISKLSKLSMVASNATKMAEIMKKAKNQTMEMEMIKGAAAKLATLTSNKTEVAMCAAMKSAKEGNKANSTAGAAPAASASATGATASASATSGASASAIGGSTLMLVSFAGLVFMFL